MYRFATVILMLTLQHSFEAWSSMPPLPQYTACTVKHSPPG